MDTSPRAASVQLLHTSTGPTTPTPTAQSGSDTREPTLPAQRAPQRRRRIPLAAIVLTLAAVALGGWWLIHHRAQAIAQTIAASGTIEAIQVDVASKVSGRIQALLVRDGDRVKAGEPVARIDPADARLAVQQAGANLDAASARLELAQAAYALQRDVNASGVSQANAQVAASAAKVPQAVALAGVQQRSVSSQVDAAAANVRSASAALDVARATLAAADADVKSAQAADGLARSTLRRNAQLYHQGDISAQQYDQSEAAAQTASAQASAATARRDALAKQVIAGESNLRAARANLDLAIASEETIAVKQLDVTASSAQLEQSKAVLQTARAQTHALDQRAADVAAAKADVAQARAALALARRQLDETTLRAPFDGIVLSHSAEVGDLIVPQTPVVAVADIDHPYLDVFVSETDLARVRLGESADVTVDGAPGRVFKGRVSSIGTTAEFTPSNVQTKEQRAELVFKVRIDLPADQTLKPGLPADGEIAGGG